MLSTIVILFEIISRLPSKVVIQCKVVCKEWKQVLESFEFARVNAIKRRLYEQKLISVSPQSCMISILNDSPYGVSLVRLISIPFDSCPYTLDILASCDGLLCVSLDSTSDLYLWNPSTGNYKNISKTLNGDRVYAIYLDCVGMFVDSTNDYKVVHIKRRCGNTQACVYSVRSGTWKIYDLIKDRPYYADNFCWSRGTLCGSGLYYVAYDWANSGNVFIFRYDVDSNLLSEVRVPDDLCSGVGIPPHEGYMAVGIMVNIKDELHMFIFKGFDLVSVELWKFENDSWSKVIVYPYLMSLPLSIRARITYVHAMESCVMTTERGDVFHIELNGNEDGGFFPISLFENVTASIFSDTIVSPCV